MFSEHYSCPECDFTIGALEPAMFSFNSPLGVCPECRGLGYISQVDPDLLITDENVSIAEGAIRYLRNIVFTENIEWQMYKKLFDYYHIDVFKPYKDLTAREKEIILYGSPDPISYEVHSTGGITMRRNRHIEGVATLIDRRFKETTSNMQREYYGSYMHDSTCPTCKGQRLSPTVLAVLVDGKNIHEFTNLSIRDAYRFIENLNLTTTEAKISHLILKEIKARLQFLINVGLDYLTLSRSATTLSGGEAQRIRLATQIGSRLTGVLYVLDEPSIGLHQSDNAKLINTLKAMRNLGNTLIVVEHDEEIMRQSDYLVDIGPGAGVHGGGYCPRKTGRILSIRKHRRLFVGQTLYSDSAGKKNRRNQVAQNLRLCRKQSKKHRCGYPIGTLYGGYRCKRQRQVFARQRYFI